MVVILAGLFMGCPTLLSPSICYVMLFICFKKPAKAEISVDNEHRCLHSML